MKYLRSLYLGGIFTHGSWYEATEVSNRIQIGSQMTTFENLKNHPVLKHSIDPESKELAQDEEVPRIHKDP